MGKQSKGKPLAIHSKAVYAVGMATQAQNHVQHPGGLWYHAVGMLNAYYALREELSKRTKNTTDQHLRAAVDAWLNTNQVAADSFFGKARSKGRPLKLCRVPNFYRYAPEL